jgi:uncharacterized membrane protein YoaK (UPF0700 family)
MIDRPRHLPLMLTLTFSTGIIDAVGYLGLDRVFTGNMTGNVVILGMALTGADGLPVAGPVVALGAFMAGAALAGAVLRRAIPGWTPTATGLFAAVAGVLAVGAAYLALDPDPEKAAVLGVTGLLGMAMGMQAGTARHVAVREVTTVVVTSTITALAAESWFGTRRGAQLPRRGSAIALIMLGAAVGAMLLHWHPAAGVAFAAVISGLVAFLGERDRRAAASLSALRTGATA